MLSEREKIEFDVLNIMKGSVQPMGCGSISAKMNILGHSISEATIGRILRDLDAAGYTDKAGYQGRCLSFRGFGRVTELSTKERWLMLGTELIGAVQGHTKEQLLEVLIARRAIEGELAYLAASNATDEDKIRLRAALDRQRDSMGRGDGSAEGDVEFHNIIAGMACNRVLATAIALIRQDTQLSPSLEYIRRHVKRLTLVDHKKIYNGIIHTNPIEAKEAMIEHINNLILDVEKYWKKIIKIKS